MEKIVFAKDITLYKADCLEVMPFLPESSIDLVLCDPPFGITASQWDKIIPFPEMWKEIRRVRKKMHLRSYLAANRSAAFYAAAI